MRIAWFRVITDLEANGVTLRSQAEEAGVVVGTVSYWKAGGEPKHYNGQRLLNLYVTRLQRQPPLEATAYST